MLTNYNIIYHCQQIGLFAESILLLILVTKLDHGKDKCHAM